MTRTNTFLSKLKLKNGVLFSLFMVGLYAGCKSIVLIQKRKH